tara:strand:- start:923 stop:1123 length:201 start_codon:yes stop_codon:yes gene_type:complete
MSLKDDIKYKGENDLEVKIKILEKEIDTLKTIIDLKDLELQEKDNKEMKKFLNDLSNNTPNAEQFE